MLVLTDCGVPEAREVPAGQYAPHDEPAAVQAVAAAAVPLSGQPEDHARLLTAIGGARRVLLGESTHGSREYYRERARLTMLLVRHADVQAIAIEGDWTPTSRVNRYVRGIGTDRSAADALQSYSNFPRWMWRNTDFRDFVEELRTLNLTRPANERVGLYGMDVYDLFDAADAVVAYLGQADAAAAERVRGHYRCFAGHRRDTSAYGAATSNPRLSCQEEAAAALAEVRRLPRPTEASAAEAQFAALRSAASVAAAEDYFRTLYRSSTAWNVRDQHMARNVEEIAGHVERLSGRTGKVVMWSHNTHSGDARATDAGTRGELNIGQLMKQQHGAAAFAIGLLSYTGTVRAAPAWGERARSYDLRPAIQGSYSHLFRQTGLPAFSIVFRGNQQLSRALAGPMLERAIGVIYLPSSERVSHYFEARLPDQFDAAIFFDRTEALEPL